MKKNRHTSQEIRNAFDKLMNDQKKEIESKNTVNVVRELPSSLSDLRNSTL
jgi:hypothetical protein